MDSVSKLFAIVIGKGVKCIVGRKVCLLGSLKIGAKCHLWGKVSKILPGWFFRLIYWLIKSGVPNTLTCFLSNLEAIMWVVKCRKLGKVGKSSIRRVRREENGKRRFQKKYFNISKYGANDSCDKNPRWPTSIFFPSNCSYYRYINRLTSSIYLPCPTWYAKLPVDQWAIPVLKNFWTS